MPGMAPIAEPIQEQRRIRNQLSKQSLMPSSMPVLVSSVCPACTTAMRPMARSHSSGSAKMPSVSGTSGRPSHRYRVSRVQRSVPDCGSVPIMRSIMPKHAKVSPRSGALPDSTATIEMPNTAMREQFGRADIENDRPHDRQRDRHQRRAEQAADQRRHVGGAERAAGFAAPRHRIAVERRCRRCGVARRAEQDCRDRIGGRGGRAQPEQQRERGRRIEVVGEGQQQRRAGDAADPRQDAERQPHAHAGEQIEHARSG